jgi:hypothetical protein
VEIPSLTTPLTPIGASRARRPAAAAPRQAINSQYNLPPVEQLSAPAPEAKSRRIDDGQASMTRTLFQMLFDLMPLQPPLDLGDPQLPLPAC